MMFSQINIALYASLSVPQKQKLVGNICKSPRIAPDRPGSPKAIRPKVADRPYLMVVWDTWSAFINIILIKGDQSHGSPSAEPRIAFG